MTDVDGRLSGVRVRAPAKVNLTLRVLERRPDGYHELETVFQAIDLCDEVEVRVVGGEGVALRVIGAEIGRHEDNLVMRAAQAFRAEGGGTPGLELTLTKRIPAGAGLGGGSSDAGATLRALARLFPGTVTPARLHDLAATLGSDVPFFTQNEGRVLGRGKGERMRPLAPLPTGWLVVGLPPVHVATPAAYGQLAAARTEDGGRVPAPLFPPPAPLPADWEGVAALAVNDFEGVVEGMHPPVGRTLAALRTPGALFTLLSGSGAAAFALHRDRESAEQARASARATCPESRFVIARTLARLPEAEPLRP